MAVAWGWARRIWPAAAYQACFIGAVALLKSGANAVVLSRYSAQALPWLYLGSAAATAALAGWNAARPDSRRLSPAVLAMLGAVAALGLTAALVLGWPLVALLSYVFAEVFATTTALSLWGALAEAFDAREARRAFTVISGLGMLGAVLGGLLAQGLAVRWGAPSLMAGGAALLLSGALAFRFHVRPAVSAPRRSAQPDMGVWRYVAENHYARLLGALVLGLSVLSVITDYFFRERVGAAMGEAQMASMFGGLQLWTGVFGAVFQLVLAEVLLRRLGILRYLAVVPAMLGVLAVGAVVVNSVWATWALKLFEGAATFSLLPVGVQLLYAPLPDSIRDGVRAAIDGFLRKGGLLLGGLGLVAVAQLVNETALGLTVVALAIALCGLLLKIRPAYLEVLHDRVSGAGALKFDAGDERWLYEVLRSDQPDRVLRAVDLLEASGAPVSPHLRTLLTHRHERVREKGVQLAVELRAMALAPLLEPLVRGPDRRPRDAAVWALSALAPVRARELLPPLLSSADIGLKTSAIGALLAVDPRAPEPLEALHGLLERSPTAPVAERREVARLLGRLKDPTLALALARSMDDADASVRQVAIRAVGEGAYESLAPRLLRFLTWRDERRVARQALEALGESVVPLLAQALDDRSRALALRYQLPRVLRQVGTQSAFDALLFSNARDDAFLHYRVGVALSRLKDARPTLKVDREQVLGALERRRTVYRSFVEPWSHLRKSFGLTSLVTRALGDRLDQAFELSFLLLGLLHGERLMRRAHAQLRATDPKGRAWARELLDNLLADEERDLVADQLERHHGARPEGLAARSDAALVALCNNEDAMVRACARAVARGKGRWPRGFQEDDMSEATVRRLFGLEGVEIFAESDVDDLTAIAAVAREQSFAKGTRVYSEGDPGEGLYVIVEGSVEARRAGELVMTMKAREAFGELSLFDGAPRVTEIVALEELKTLVIDRRDFLDLIADRPELLTGVFRVLSRQLKSVVVELAARKTVTGETPAATDGTPPVRRVD